MSNQRSNYKPTTKEKLEKAEGTEAIYSEEYGIRRRANPEKLEIIEHELECIFHEGF